MNKSFFTVSLFLITIFLTTFISNTPVVLGQCVDFPDIFDLKGKSLLSQNKLSSKIKNDIPSGVNPPSKNMIQLNFTCDLNDTNGTCAKAQKGFEGAINIINSLIELVTPIIVDASFVNLHGPIGNAGPSRFIPLQDKDNVTRLYPQALAKQFQFDTHPEFAPNDIIAAFTSASNNIFWFRDDPSPPTNTQVDFELVVVHELIHGLGLLSSWTDYFTPFIQNAITPFPSFIMSIEGPDVPPKNGTITFTGFQETAFDRYLVFTNDGTPVSTVTSKINEFAGGVNSGATFDNKSTFLSAFKSSPQFEFATDIFKQASTASSMGFLPQDSTNAKDSILCETSLVPFLSGSSITHTDFSTFANSTDFLMVWKAPRGVTLDQLTNANGTNRSNVIGPKTIKILETLGYKTVNNPNPYKPNAPSSNPNAQGENNNNQ
ncbi:30246_t:CDS:2 [Gigaspora margarita]|uniref:30246_t:CDS:1 n=1 Tax=Gigaspora margarita TaxID=4874 RepID=A0ABN7VC82_GIGMA|nr:30246_t:CDS:2 [Gigaspora margarita]